MLKLLRDRCGPLLRGSYVKTKMSTSVFGPFHLLTAAWSSNYVRPKGMDRTPKEALLKTALRSLGTVVHGGRCLKTTLETTPPPNPSPTPPRNRLHRIVTHPVLDAVSCLA